MPTAEAIRKAIRAVKDPELNLNIEDVKRVVSDLEGVRSVEVELVWEPYWTPEKMDPRVRTFLGF